MFDERYDEGSKLKHVQYACFYCDMSQINKWHLSILPSLTLKLGMCRLFKNVFPLTMQLLTDLNFSYLTCHDWQMAHVCVFRGFSDQVDNTSVFTWRDPTTTPVIQTAARRRLDSAWLNIQSLTWMRLMRSVRETGQTHLPETCYCSVLVLSLYEQVWFANPNKKKVEVVVP